MHLNELCSRLAHNSAKAVNVILTRFLGFTEREGDETSAS